MPEPRHRELPARYRDGQTTGMRPLENQSATNCDNRSNTATQLLRSSQASSQLKTKAAQRHIKGLSASIQVMS